MLDRAGAVDDPEAQDAYVDAMEQSVKGLNFKSGPPHVMLARTTFGRGVSYMESEIKWHYLPIDEELYRQALQEIEVLRR